MKSFYINSQGEEICSAQLSNLWNDVYVLFCLPWGKHKDESIWYRCIYDCLEQTKSQNVKTIWTRIRDDEFAPSFVNALRKLNFKRMEDRVEFKTLVDLLPDDSDSPISWKYIDELNWTRKDLINFVFCCGDGDPDFDQDEHFADDWFENDELTHGPKCISVGFFEGGPCAISVVQINHKTGWSRISYMGLIKQMRGKKLGQYVHRRGFSEIKKAGGTLYHGGTAAKNTPMISLFELHGCKHFVNYQQWCLQLDYLS